MRIVFMGTPEYAATILEELSYQHEIACVYTRPDAVRGRGNNLVASPVKEVAERLNLPVRTPITLRDPDEVAALAEFQADCFVVAAYGAILPREVIELPHYGCINAHASILPRWRGAAPIERAILAGDEQVGVCTMRIEEGLDTGDYCVCRTTDIADKDCTALTIELADLGARALLTALVHIESGSVHWEAQDESLVTYAKKIEKGELDLSTSDSAEHALRKIRASSAAHPSKLRIAGKTVTVQSAVAVNEGHVAFSAIQEGGLPEGAAQLCAKRLIVGFDDGALELTQVKPDGKKPMEGRAFAAGIQGIKSGTTWEGLHD